MVRKQKMIIKRIDREQRETAAGQVHLPLFVILTHSVLIAAAVQPCVK